MTHSASYYDGDHVGMWITGQCPIIEKVLAVVTYDQRHNAYIIEEADKYDFQEWVCGEWFEDYELESDEPVEFLEHNGVDVKFINLGDVA